MKARITFKQIRQLKKIAKGLRSITQMRESEESEDKNWKRRLEAIEKKEYVVISGDIIKLSKKGKVILANMDEEDFTIKKPDKWDGTWHLVAYDIPEEFRKERDYFRNKLKDLEFTKIQASLWIFPYSCEEEFALFADHLSISPFIVLMETNRVPNQTKLLLKYNLT